ncbi:FtsL-like putative cell division protein [Solitalea sp. MAHUQ-68]|uniref:FtsL-like putative cell division protein n=1 Tax=Solitalea agri TaxID=2953739 RepID=A0A9X2JD33_9SPHI|nr:FtsL-like putative cell division protein [Solitalea agri]MCO4292435.1 FtsL-like putative cell division protein [Solitalea agri]
MQNTLRDDLEPKLKEVPKEPKALPRNFFTLLLKGDFITEKTAISWLPYFVFLGGIAMAYITNRHFAERNIREIDKANKDLKELRWEYMTTKAELMFLSKQTEVAARAEKIGLKESIEPPKKIVIQENEN